MLLRTSADLRAVAEDGGVGEGRRMSKYVPYHYDEHESYYDDYERQRDEMIEEIGEWSDQWAASNEEGWFYPDEM